MHRLHVPSFKLRLNNGAICEFAADHLGLYTIERITKMSLFDYFRAGDRRVTQFYEVAYALSASWREDAGVQVEFLEFLRLLPLAHFLEIHDQLNSLVAESIQAGAPRGNWLKPARGPARGGTGSNVFIRGLRWVGRCLSSGARALGSLPRWWSSGTLSNSELPEQVTSTHSQDSGAK